jgi:hypothetical protein
MASPRSIVARSRVLVNTARLFVLKAERLQTRSERGRRNARERRRSIGAVDAPAGTLEGVTIGAAAASLPRNAKGSFQQGSDASDAYLG